AGGEAALALLGQEVVDAVVTDLNMRAMSGLELCRRVLSAHPDLPVLVLTAFGSMESAVDALRAGAWDYITKPVDMEDLARRLARAVENSRLRREVARLRRREADRAAFGTVIGRSGVMRRVFDVLERVAATDIGVLITGESGTGKEVVARSLHEASDRRRGPFIAVNCAALPEQLLESELFGHGKGAFTGAQRAKNGLFVEADGGTLLLDEIGEMPLAMQVKLLRALEDRRVRPVGEAREVAFDARLLAATNQDLHVAIAEGRFREDLYYRLNVVTIELPPLRTRGDDILLLAEAFIREMSERHGVAIRGLSAEAADRLLAHDWPGNVRELRNCIERAVALARHDTLRVSDLPPAVRAAVPAGRAPKAMAAPAPEPVAPVEEAEESPVSALLPMHEVERQHILRVLDAVEGSRTRAAEVLDLDRKTLYRKLKRYGVEG
ncbi:MAG: sigma-54-dependent Fis family transcriptional regulator, partial [Myxococcales bacterium]|nr:sigma-54-dependent Fis family transcriptional regulator [Myxococcales bacterium]